MFGFLAPIAGALFGSSAAAAATIGVGGQLIGGVMQRNAARRDVADQNAYNDPAAQRARFEAAGFNPLVGVQNLPSASVGAGGGAVGHALANASLTAGDGMQADRLEKIEAQKLEAENKKLKGQLEKKTLAPTVGGVFGGGDTPHPVSSSANRGIMTDSDPYGVSYDPSLPIGGPRPNPASLRARRDFPVTDLSSGAVHYITRGAAERLELQKYQAVIGEDLEALLGDNAVSAGLNIVNAPVGAYSVGSAYGSGALSLGRQLVGELPKSTPEPKDPPKSSEHKESWWSSFGMPSFSHGM